jgi:predicted CopG family antitoxin
MVDKIRVVKKIKISADAFKKVKKMRRLEFFWDMVAKNIKTKDKKIDVTRVRVGGDLAKILNKNPWLWLDIGPCVNSKLKKHQDFFIVELCTGWNLKNRRKTAEEKIKEMLLGSDARRN